LVLLIDKLLIYNFRKVRKEMEIVIILSAVILIVLLFVLFVKKLALKDNPRLFKLFVNQYSRIDKQRDIQQSDIVFTGSSVVKFWKTMEPDLFPFKVINRGIAGAKINEITYWIDNLVLKYTPRVVLLYVGSNDIQGKKPRSAVDVFNGFIDFERKVHTQYPDLPVIFLSIIPSPAKTRWENWAEIKKANNLIGEYCQQKESLHYIDTTDRFLTEMGLPDNHYFKKDGIHLNESGYKIWQSELKPVLKTVVD